MQKNDHNFELKNVKLNGNAEYGTKYSNFTLFAK
jgi:hypothetical protein